MGEGDLAIKSPNFFVIFNYVMSKITNIGVEEN